MADHISGELKFGSDGSISGRLYCDLRETVRRQERSRQRSLVARQLFESPRFLRQQTETLVSRLPRLTGSDKTFHGPSTVLSAGFCYLHLRLIIDQRGNIYGFSHYFLLFRQRTKRFASRLIRTRLSDFTRPSIG